MKLVIIYLVEIIIFLQIKTITLWCLIKGRLGGVKINEERVENSPKFNRLTLFLSKNFFSSIQNEYLS